jgi:sigma-70-like protein
VVQRTTRNRQPSARTRRRHAAGACRLSWDTVRAVLDAEVGRLPRSVRATFILCTLEGKTPADATRELDCQAGTVLRRLLRAREILRRQLGRRGIRLSALLAALALAEGDEVPAKLVQLAVRASLAAVCGEERKTDETATADR